MMKYLFLVAAVASLTYSAHIPRSAVTPDEVAAKWATTKEEIQSSFISAETTLFGYFDSIETVIVAAEDALGILDSSRGFLDAIQAIRDDAGEENVEVEECLKGFLDQLPQLVEVHLLELNVTITAILERFHETVEQLAPCPITTLELDEEVESCNSDACADDLAESIDEFYSAYLSKVNTILDEAKDFAAEAESALSGVTVDADSYNAAIVALTEDVASCASAK